MKKLLFTLFLLFLGILASAQDFKTLSVLYFTNTAKNTDHQWLSRGLTDMVVSDLGSLGKITLVEREELEKLLAEQEFMTSGMADASQAPALGKILGADRLVYGSFVVLGPQIRLDAKAVDPATGAVKATASASGSFEKLLDLVPDLARKLAAGLGLVAEVPAVSGTMPASGSPRVLSSAKAYYTGELLLESGDYKGAVKLFTEAVELDPLFTRAGVGLEEAYKYLRDFRSQRYRREMNTIAADIEALERRIRTTPFSTFSDMAINPAKYGLKDAAEASALYQAHPTRFAGETPLQAVWNLQLQYMDLAGKAEEYFEDAALQGACMDQILAWAQAGERAWGQDPWLPEVLYLTQFTYRHRQDWKGLMALCERIMEHWPDFRMMWAIEDAYEAALEALGALES